MIEDLRVKQSYALRVAEEFEERGISHETICICLDSRAVLKIQEHGDALEKLARNTVWSQRSLKQRAWRHLGKSRVSE